ncbi:MAG: SGNH/GDSL hydrolase family protein [Planctomycetota bacterium]|jgi:lysophospholipase L1-like esterase
MGGEPAATTGPDTDEATRGRGRRLGRRLFVFAATLLGVLAAIEGYARHAYENPLVRERQLEGMYVNAEGGGVATQPGFRGELTVDGITTDVRLNNLGLRGPDVGPREPDEVRVLCLGDSFTFGYGVEADASYPAVLRDVLARRLGRPVVTGNAGVPGYGSVEQARCLDRLMDTFDPDVVAMTIYFGNDFRDDQVLDSYVVDGLPLTGVWARTVQSSWRARLMLRSRAMMWLENSLMQSGHSLAIQPVLSQKERQAAVGYPPEAQQFAGLWMDVADEGAWRDAEGTPIVGKALDRVADSLRAMQQRAGDVPVLVLIVPSWFHLEEADRVAELQRMELDPADFRRGLAQQRLAALCADLSIPVVDLGEALDASGDPKSFYLPVNRHLNVDGHVLAATQLAARIDALLTH